MVSWSACRKFSASLEFGQRLLASYFLELIVHLRLFQLNSPFSIYEFNRLAFFWNYISILVGMYKCNKLHILQGKCSSRWNNLVADRLKENQIYFNFIFCSSVLSSSAELTSNVCLTLIFLPPFTPFSYFCAYMLPQANTRCFNLSFADSCKFQKYQLLILKQLVSLKH